MSLPTSKLVCGIGEAPVTGAWMPMTISVSVTPAVSLPPGSYGPTGIVAAAGAVLATPGVEPAVAPGTVDAPDPVPGVADAAGCVTAGCVTDGSCAPASEPATPAF